MAWTLDKSSADFRRWNILTAHEMQIWDAFQNEIRSQGVHPHTAAEDLGKVGGKQNAGYESLTGIQYQIRLSYATAPRSRSATRAWAVGRSTS